MRKFLNVVGVVALVGFGFLLGTRGGASSDPGHETKAMPMVLRQVQALGELHSARFTYENVFEHRTYLKPEGLLASFPGADSITRAATENEALVSANGSVEAGVDLAKAKTDGNRIVLPHATVYEPQVEAKLHEVHRRLFWRDDNIGLDALDNAKQRMRSAAETQGIRDEAERNALAQVQKLVPATVSVVFQ